MGNPYNNAQIEALAAAKRARTKCIHGHEFTEENTYHHPNGSRRCRECQRYRLLRFKIKLAFILRRNPYDRRHGTINGYVVGCRCYKCAFNYSEKRKSRANGKSK